MTLTNISESACSSDSNKTAAPPKSFSDAPLPSSTSAQAHATAITAAPKAKLTRNATSPTRADIKFANVASLAEANANAAETSPTEADIALAQSNFAHLFAQTMRLYTLGETASISKHEAVQLSNSLAYVLGVHNLSFEETIHALAVPNVDALYEQQLELLEKRVDSTLELWRNVCATMPPLNNVSLRDTLASIGNLRSLYDTRFAAHEIPCSIDYQLSVPVSDDLQGIDYLWAWLQQALAEARYLAQFDTQDCILLLQRICPDYRGLHVNLYDLVKPYENELKWKQASEGNPTRQQPRPLQNTSVNTAAQGIDARGCLIANLTLAPNTPKQPSSTRHQVRISDPNATR